MRLIEPPISVRELLLDDPTNEFSISLVSVSMALVAGLGKVLASHSVDAGGKATLNFSLLSVDDGDDSVQLTCSTELVDMVFIDFFFLRGGAIGPDCIRLSVVFE